MFTGEEELPCPSKRVCSNGFLVPCNTWEYATDENECFVCPLHSYCKKHKIYRCPPHSITSGRGQEHENDCFCMANFTKIISNGTQSGFLCQSVYTQKIQQTLSIQTFEKSIYMKHDKQWAIWYNKEHKTQDVMGAVIEFDFTNSLFVMHGLFQDTTIKTVSYMIPEYTSTSYSEIVLSSLHSYDGVIFHAIVYCISLNVNVFVLRIGFNEQGIFTNIITQNNKHSTIIKTIEPKIPIVTLSLVTNNTLFSIACYNADGSIYKENTATLVDGESQYSPDSMQKMTFNNETYYLDVQKCKALRSVSALGAVSSADPLNIYTERSHKNEILYVGRGVYMHTDSLYLAVSNFFWIGFVHVEWKICPANSYSNENSNFECLCGFGYKQSINSNTCTGCDTGEFCPPNTNEAQQCNSTIEKSRECNCRKGYYYDVQSTDCVVCPADFFCDGVYIYNCPYMSVTLKNGADSIYDCKCTDGYFWNSVNTYSTTPYQEHTVDSVCTVCPIGYVCNQKQDIIKCYAHSTTANTGESNMLSCVCENGYIKNYMQDDNDLRYCIPVGYGLYSAGLIHDTYNECPQNYTTITNTASNVNDCVCMSSFKQVGSSCIKCEISEICPVNTTQTSVITCSALQEADKTISKCICIPGYYNREGACILCSAGFYCRERDNIVHMKCPSLMTSQLGSAYEDACYCIQRDFVKVAIGTERYMCMCGNNYYNNGNVCTRCPKNSRVLLTNPNNYGNMFDCVCEVGYMSVSDGLTKRCDLCPTAHYCPYNANEKPQKCRYGTFSLGIGQKSEDACIQCPNMQTYDITRPSRQDSILHCITSFIPFNVSIKSINIQVFMSYENVHFIQYEQKKYNTILCNTHTIDYIFDNNDTTYTHF